MLERRLAASNAKLYLRSAMDALEKLQSSLAGRYAVVREVGAGRMATVYLAQDVKHDLRPSIY